MQKLLKPKALKQGDKVASVSLSWGGAGVFRAFYQKAKKQFETTFDVRLVEMPHTLDTPQELYDNPAYRLDCRIRHSQKYFRIFAYDVKMLVRHVGQQADRIISANRAQDRPHRRVQKRLH